MNLANIRKFLVALGGAAAEAVSLGLLEGIAEKWITGLIAVATSFIVYFVPNGNSSNGVNYPGV